MVLYMKIIVPGASGHIGKNFLLRAPKNWSIIAIYNRNSLENFVKENGLENVKPVKCDLSNEKDVNKLSALIGNEFDVCLYLAANTLIPSSVTNPIFDLQANTLTVLNFLNYFRGDRIIFLSSGAVYDGLSGYVNPEILVSPKIPYSISKLASENYVQHYVKKKNTFKAYIILRFFGAYGPYENSRKIYSKLINAFYFENRNEFKVYGDGNNLIDAMYIDDTIDGILKTITSSNKNVIVDFCSGSPLTINELVYTTARTFGKEKPIIKHEGITEEYIDFYVSPDRMDKLFGFKPVIPLEDGLLKFTHWMKNR